MRRLSFHDLIACIVFLWFSQVACAAQDAVFGTVWKIKGDVTATSTEGKSRSLKEGDPVYVREQIKASANAEAVVKTLDTGMVAVRPGAHFVAESFAALGQPTDNQALRLLSGSLRVISGWIAKANPSAYTVTTPAATIGIRGTDHEPYVLSADQAKGSNYKEGTYDKVNRGGTTLTAGENSVDIDPGKVGFVRNKPKQRTRALMTLLLPVLLDHIPNFYVPGEFDAELDRYSQELDASTARPLSGREKTASASPSPVAAPAGSSVMEGGCAINQIAEKWLATLDQAIERGDSATILALYAPTVQARATVRTADGTGASIDFDRDELVSSTLSAIKGISHYKHRRITTSAKFSPGSSETVCKGIQIKSVVLEQGTMSGKPYRFESTEDISLELQGGKWLAVVMETVQR